MSGGHRRPLLCYIEAVTAKAKTEHQRLNAAALPTLEVPLTLACSSAATLGCLGVTAARCGANIRPTHPRLRPSTACLRSKGNHRDRAALDGGKTAYRSRHRIL